MADPLQQFLPATQADWTQARPGANGSIEYVKTNPAWTAQQLQQAIAQRQALTDLMQRQSGLAINPNLVGIGVSDNGAFTTQDLMRKISQTLIGQPYGLLSPPTVTDVASADEKVRQANIDDAQANRDKARLADLLMGKK